jgi:hypothetical protein
MSNKIIRQVRPQPPSRVVPSHSPVSKATVQHREASFGGDPAVDIAKNRTESDRANRGKGGKPISAGY